jgi:hypothetical protein
MSSQQTCSTECGSLKRGIPLHKVHKQRGEDKSYASRIPVVGSVEPAESSQRRVLHAKNTHAARFMCNTKLFISTRGTHVYTFW